MSWSLSFIFLHIYIYIYISTILCKFLNVCSKPVNTLIVVESPHVFLKYNSFIYISCDYFPEARIVTTRKTSRTFILAIRITLFFLQFTDYIISVAVLGNISYYVRAGVAQ